MRNYTLRDKLILAADNLIKTVFSTPQGTNRDNPASHIKEGSLSLKEQRYIAGLMRINHCGEVCAQALYQGQALTARNTKLQANFITAANEENDHLLWCAQRLHELNSRPSYFNLLWYTNSLAIGTIAGIIGDNISISFLAATEEQVCKHLQQHLILLPAEDKKSHAILTQMYQDELKHKNTALELGATTLPKAIQRIMQIQAKIMTTITYYC